MTKGQQEAGALILEKAGHMAQEFCHRRKTSKSEKRASAWRMRVHDQVEILVGTKKRQEDDQRQRFKRDTASLDLLEQRTASLNEDMWKSAQSNDTRSRSCWDNTMTMAVAHGGAKEFGDKDKVWKSMMRKEENRRRRAASLEHVIDARAGCSTVQECANTRSQKDSRFIVTLAQDDVTGPVSSLAVSWICCAPGTDVYVPRKRCSM